jgi:hypothetical protein
VEKGEEETSAERLTILRTLVDEGRENEENLKKVMPLMAMMCLYDMEKTYKYSAASNFKKKLNEEEAYKELNGHTLSDKMSPQRLSMFLLVVDNYMPEEGGAVSDDDEALWPCEGNQQKYTKPAEVAKNGGWSKEGIERYAELLGREIRERRKMKTNYKDNKEQRPDYFHYDPPSTAVSEARDEAEEITNFEFQAADDDDEYEPNDPRIAVRSV